MEIIIQNVRSIVKRQTVPLAPLTILVGENSSGKSTFLATLSIVSESSSYPLAPKFNEAPYKLGSYDTIATYKGGKYGRAKFFAIGHRTQESPQAPHSEVLAHYASRRGQIQLSKLFAKSGRIEFDLNIKEGDETKYTAKLTTDDGEVSRFDIDRKPSDTIRFELFVFKNLVGLEQHNAEPENAELKKLERRLKILEGLSQISKVLNPTTSLSIAPIRTKPNRTYDQVLEAYDPEGTHIPFVLAKMLSRESSKAEKETLWKGLIKFGEESGLFSRIGVKELGAKIGDPFQIMVTPSGRAANLLDVGYGVSQALPVVVQTILLDRSQLLLLQQPEVHLHPKAQAALGSFFAQQVAEGGKRFVIETHSDFILDRIRQEIAGGKLDGNLVRILFFRKRRFETTIHSLRLDSLGNVIGAPPGYREFFLREELSLYNKTGGNT